MQIEYLPWDSDFFGFKIGRLEIDGNQRLDPISFKKQAIKDNFKLVYVFSYGKMLNWKSANMADVELVDIMITMTKSFEGVSIKDYPYEFRTELSSSEIEDCYNIAEQTSFVSRFYHEPTVGPAFAAKLYRKWIDNALNKSFSDGLFLYKESNKVLGVHLIRTDINNETGYFTLTGVESNVKGKGLGKSLWMQSFSYWANEYRIKIIKSPFSFQNKESLNFHLKMGFNKITEIKYIYHFRNSIYK